MHSLCALVATVFSLLNCHIAHASCCLQVFLLHPSAYRSYQDRIWQPKEQRRLVQAHSPKAESITTAVDSVLRPMREQRALKFDIWKLLIAPVNGGWTQAQATCTLNQAWYILSLPVVSSPNILTSFIPQPLFAAHRSNFNCKLQASS
jgi:hypothetical protein